jgi:transitional endoplasmic reticulum ATPase
MTRHRDPAKESLGWYVRNCALSPSSAQLEDILLDQLTILRTVTYNSKEDHVSGPKLRGRKLREFHHLLKRYTKSPRSGESLEQNTVFACEEFGLDPTDAEILLLLLKYERYSELEAFADSVSRCLNSISRGIAALIGIDAREIHRRIVPGGALVESGILTINDDCTHPTLTGPCGFLVLSHRVRKHMFRPYTSREEWVAAVLGPPLSPELTWADFDHLGSICDFAARVLEGCGKDKTKGVNLLLHGPVGTGKTELCKVLAAKSGMKIWSIGETDEYGGEPMRVERLASFRLAQRLLAKRQNVIVLFDEAEDLLRQSNIPFRSFSEKRQSNSKVYINRLIEQNVVPVIWTCNEVDEIDPAVLRRMTLAVEVKTPNQPARERIWRRILAGAKLQLDDDTVRGLSERYIAPPAVAANAARAAALSNGGEVEIEQAMGGVLQILGIASHPQNRERHFDPHLTNCSENLTLLVEQLARADAPRNWSVCLHGAPGTGKSQFARHLAARIGMEVVQQRASDLLSQWVGGSEKRIAGAFTAAKAQGSMLVIDEADSLLSDRRGATRSWEVSQVNEMLTWMESHPLPFVCTTNLMDRLDQASLRRFTLKLRFEPLNSAQALRAFRHFFAIAAPHCLPEGLTPGDFATVRRKRDVYGSADPALLISWLEEELEAKGTPTRKIGFVRLRA